MRASELLRLGSVGAEIMAHRVWMRECGDIRKETMLERSCGAGILRHASLPKERRADHIMAMPVPVPANTAGRRWTAQEVRQLIAESPLATPRYELIDGELLVTPSPTFVHQRAVKGLLWTLLTYLEANPIGEVLTSPFDVELELESVLQPDLFVLPPHESKRLLREMPARELLVAAEVLSPSSSRHDRVKKRPLYQRHVGEYWIVDLDARLFERWRRADERPEILTATLEWLPAGAADPFNLDVPRYFAEVYSD